jgi:hypothetical protein
MAKKSNPLIDLEAFLSENPNAAEESKPKNRTEFIHSKPSTLVKTRAKNKSVETLKLATIESLREQIEQLSKQRECSFAEVWLEIIKHARKSEKELLPTNKKQQNKWIESVAKQINKIKK